jgi:hypothetical protein
MNKKIIFKRKSYIYVILYIVSCNAFCLKATSNPEINQEIPILDLLDTTETQNVTQATIESEKKENRNANDTPLTLEQTSSTPLEEDLIPTIENISIEEPIEVAPNTEEKTSSEDSLSTEEEAAAGALAAGAIGVGLRNIAVDLMKEKATEKIKEKIDSSEKKPKGTTKKNIGLQKELINDRHAQAARKVEYYSKTENTAKKEKWEQRLKKSKKLQGKISQQEELRKKNKTETLSSEEKALNKLKQKELSKKVLGSEEKRLNARLHKYSEQPEDLSQKQLIKKEQTKDRLKNINAAKNNDTLSSHRTTKKTLIKPMIEPVFNQRKR